MRKTVVVVGRCIHGSELRYGWLDRTGHLWNYWTILYQWRKVWASYCLWEIFTKCFVEWSVEKHGVCCSKCSCIAFEGLLASCWHSSAEMILRDGEVGWELRFFMLSLRANMIDFISFFYRGCYHSFLTKNLTAESNIIRRIIMVMSVSCSLRIL